MQTVTPANTNKTNVHKAKITDLVIRPRFDSDGVWVADVARDRWGTRTVVAHGVRYRPAELPGFVAWQGHDRVGLVTYHVQGPACEIVTLDSLQPGLGVGTALIAAVRRAAVAAGCRRLWLITTNDNTDALRFYQKRGFRLVAVHRDAVSESRQLKPEIPLVGADGIPIRDEIELEMMLE